MFTERKIQMMQKSLGRAKEKSQKLREENSRLREENKELKAKLLEANDFNEKCNENFEKHRNELQDALAKAREAEAEYTAKIREFKLIQRDYEKEINELLKNLKKE